jgi:hypothetical protein
MPTAWPLGAPRPTAETLLIDPQDRPLLVTMQAGAGRSTVLGLDGTWWWRMNADHGDAIHAWFWRQLIFTAAVQRPDAVIQTDRPSYQRAMLEAGRQEIRVYARVLDPRTGGPPKNVHVEVSVRRIDEDRPTDAALGGDDNNETDTPGKVEMVDMLPESGRWVGRSGAVEAGRYRVALQARIPSASENDAPVTLAAEHRFIIEDVDLESLRPEADLELMREMASATLSQGGRYYPLSELTACLRELSGPQRRRAIPYSERFDIAEMLSWPSLLVIALGLSLEWTIRKRLGFV